MIGAVDVDVGAVVAAAVVAAVVDDDDEVVVVLVVVVVDDDVDVVFAVIDNDVVPSNRTIMDVSPFVAAQCSALRPYTCSTASN